jgi:hypothetical protein
MLAAALARDLLLLARQHDHAILCGDPDHSC